MGVTIREIKWRTANFRPVAMPSVRCPAVKDWDLRKIKPAWMGISHCNACAHVQELHIDYQAGTGEVHCAAM